MNTHPYLRAYMGGIVIPTAGLLVIMTIFTVARHVYHVPIPIERIIVFPMAIVPNLWGAWNMLYLWLHSRPRLPLGLHGAVLPFLLAPTAFLVAHALDFVIPSFVAQGFPIGFPIALIVYYLVWKHLVSFFNELLGIA